MVEAITKTTASSFCSTVRAPGHQKGGKEGLRGGKGLGTPTFTTAFATAPEEGEQGT